jgi:DNA-binding beta-propeller fold protein YncE
MYVTLRRTLVVAVLFGLAACSGGTAQTPSAPSQNASAFVGRGVPFLPPMLRAVRRDAGSGTYPIKNSLVFEGDQLEASVNIYVTKALPNNPAPIATIHVAAGCPYGMARDKSGTLYVADNCGGNDVEEYAAGSTTLLKTITNGISNPLGVAIDTHGTLYVSNYPAAITVYPKGSTTPSETITGGGLEDPFGLALDGKGNLYIADFGADAVFELPAGGTAVTNLNLQGLGEPIGLAYNLKAGYLWETDGAGNAINVYEPSSSESPFKTIAGQGNPYAISLQKGANYQRTVVESDIDTHDVYAYKPNQYTSYATLSNGVELPTGLLVTKPWNTK